MRTLLNIVVGILAATASSASAAASLQDLCVFQPVDKGSVAHISRQGVAERQSLVEDDYQVIQRLFETIRTFEDQWETPLAIWPDDATVIAIERYQEPVCNIVFDRDYLYVAMKNDSGFLRRGLSYSEYESIGAVLRQLEWKELP